jgi:hypothetical protein
VLTLPHSLTRHFRDAAGRFDFRALVRAPDERLVEVARRMSAADRIDLYRRLRGLRLGWLERMMLQGAGVDVEHQRARFLWVLEEADRSACEAVAS